MPVLAGVISCKESEADYTPAEQLTNAQAYFAVDAPSKVEISSDESTFCLPVYRQNKAGKLVLPITSVCSSDNFSVAESATFEVDSAIANIVVSYDPDKIVAGQYDTITVSFNSEYGTPYAVSTMTVLVGQAEPFAMITTDPEGAKLGKEWLAYDKDKNVIGSYCKLRDDVITGFYNVANHEYKVLIEENQVKKGVYRLLNPYGLPYPENRSGEYDPTEDTDETYMVINASDPDAVYMEQYVSPADWGSGFIGAWSLANYYMERKGLTIEEIKADPGLSAYLGKLENGVITFPAGSLLINEEGYNEGAYYITNPKGLFRIILPGVEVADYSAEVNYLGYFVDGDNAPYAVVNVKWGADVKSGKLTLVSSDGNTVYNTKELEAAGEYRMAFPEGVTGKFKFVLEVMNGDGDVVATAEESFKFNGLGNTEETWSALYVGSYYYGLDGSEVSDDEYYANFWKYGFWSIGDANATLYISDSDETRYKVSPWNDGELVFTWTDEDGILVSDESLVGTEEGYGTFYGGEASFLADVFGMDIPQSYYDDETGVFHFNVSYTLGEDELYSWQEETFALTGMIESSARKVLNVANRTKRPTGKLGKKSFKNRIMRVRSASLVRSYK